MANENFKDAKLDWLASRYNVAQFVSFDPGEPKLRYSHILGHDSLEPDPYSQISRLLSISHSVNVRAFRPGLSKGAPFFYGLENANDAAAHVQRLAREGFYTIVNETIDVHDGGVSGVRLGGIVEFAPDDTPRAVENADAFAAEEAIGMRMLSIVYGFAPDVPGDLGQRVEFSIHPSRVGLKKTHTLLWELEQVDPVNLAIAPAWPNRFSRFLGDKAFGLLLADSMGLAVPQTVVISRRVAPFSFGSDTGSSERWLRTCPTEPVPGRFTTTFGWADPFRVLAEEDPTGTAIPSVLSQQAVNAVYSGASLPGLAMYEDEIQGVAGRGDLFMRGAQPPETLPVNIVQDVRNAAASVRDRLGPVRMEWAHDGTNVWVVQMHIASEQKAGVISPGNAEEWLPYDPKDGLELLRELAQEAVRRRAGVVIVGPVGATSHVGDILRKEGIPGRILTER